MEQGAKFGPFAGFEMPLFYPAGIMREHQHVRTSAGLFDISHMVLVMLSGSDAAALVSRLCPYPAAEQQTGKARYTFFLNDEAGVIDDLIVTRFAADRFMIVCNAACAEKDLAHIREEARNFKVKIDVLERVFLALQGPQAENVITQAGLKVADMAFLDARELPGGWIISRSGYTGEDGFEIAIPLAAAADFAHKLLSDERSLMIGLGARDSLRIEAGLPLYGQDLSDTITPMEAGLAWAIPKSHRTGGSFVGATALAARFAEGRSRKRIGLKPQGAAPVRAHAPVHDSQGRTIGEVTSGGFGPTCGHPVAFGLINSDHEGALFAEVRGKQLPLEQVSLPFTPHRYKRG
ncbi:MAG: glycine cleavage system aminomethyltransferase GcvT [Nitratireductor sp.]|nr:glycine cleavage system aminomethyltransferase GcvT [Nitratireductor sp.]MCB1456469.1 glycine cleavage system aminomethyltransferase GcvT [Nitratireductor sp.]